MSNNYCTKQKELILLFIKKQDNEFTINDIKNNLSDKVGLTTIYRYVNKLVKNRIIKKNYNNNIASFQYIKNCCNSNSHYYLKCNCCGNITHISCDCMKKFSNHINENHNFKVENCSITIDGTCQNCNN